MDIDDSTPGQRSPENTLAKNILKAELARKGFSYKRLSEALAAIGIQKSPSSLAITVYRGAFSFAFFLQCMKAIQNYRIEILLDKPEP